MTKLTKEEKAELEAMLSEYVLIAGYYIAATNEEKVTRFFEVKQMQNRIFSFVESIKG